METNGWETAFSFGSNLGDRLRNLTEAKDRLLARARGRLVAQSPVYETEPVGVRPEHRQLNYLNSVLVVESSRQAGEWLHVIGDIERELGRVRTADRHAPRTIDIDLLYSGDQWIEGSLIVVPHPRWAQRRFVVQPLADVRPDRVLPGAGATVREILDALPPGEAVVRFAEDW